MRVNLPVTGIEYELSPDAALVSRTDLKGRITYANPAFIEASGFSMAELMGKAHNIVRHPDVPPEAFSDLWQTLAQGLPWTGLIKNRRKNGDFYWVLANVTPIRRNGRTQGYMSARRKPGRRQKPSAPDCSSRRTPTTSGRSANAARCSSVAAGSSSGARATMPCTGTRSVSEATQSTSATACSGAHSACTNTKPQSASGASCRARSSSSGPKDRSRGPSSHS